MGLKVELGARGGCTAAVLPADLYVTNTTGFSQPIDLATIHKVAVIASSATPLSDTVITVQVSHDYRCGGAFEANWTGTDVTFDVLGNVNGVILEEDVGEGADLICDALDSATIPVDATAAVSRYMRLYWDTTDADGANTPLFATLLAWDPNYMGGTGSWGAVPDDWNQTPV